MTATPAPPAEAVEIVAYWVRRVGEPVGMSRRQATAALQALSAAGWTLTQPGSVAVPAELLAEAAADIEAAIRAEHGDPPHPAMQRHHDRDMEIVGRLRAEAEKHDSPAWEANTRLNTKVDQLAEENERLRALAAGGWPLTPPGWMAVPIEPTQAMLDTRTEVGILSERSLLDFYRAMIAAAPKP